MHSSAEDQLLTSKWGDNMRKLRWVMTTCTMVLFLAMMPVASPAQTFTTLHSFNGKDGAYPSAGLVQLDNGNLYGTTVEGGATTVNGTVFKITPTGKLTSVHTFKEVEGSNPETGLIQATDGNLYGTTLDGGTFGLGAIFKITASGKLTSLYSFCPDPVDSCPDGYSPFAGLVQGMDGNLYGATSLGGQRGCGPDGQGCGTISKITPGGVYTVLHQFIGSDGNGVLASLIQGTNGNFYGMSQSGGAMDDGTVFQITPSGSLTTLYSFCARSGCTDGSLPTGALVQGTDGGFYGTTLVGGSGCAGQGCGTIFKITPKGRLTTLYRFCSQTNCRDGAEPYAGLIQATDGNFYGTTALNGGNGYGTIFKITPKGKLTTLHDFCSKSSCTDGGESLAPLVQDTNGNFYGTTVRGGTNANGYGTVFTLSVGLGPFVKTNPRAGKVGAKIEILGTDLTGATSVTFNGTPAVFNVVSKTLIAAHVPSGATTGKIQVKSPSRTLSSNVPFVVLP